MPRSGKKGGGKNHIGHRASDVTLDDYANCRVTATRLRKSTSNSFVREAKQCSSVEDVLRGEGDEDEDDETASALQVKFKPKASKICRKAGGDVSEGQDYPLDLWFLLSEYINPEDIHIFASLCRSALYVVRTYKFWICLYKRYYRLPTSLPENLLPENIQRPRFLRLSVIRALHYLYPPFAQRVSTTRWVDHQAYHLLQLRCIALWHARSDGKFTFFFKFCAPTRAARSALLLHSVSDKLYAKPLLEGCEYRNGAKKTRWLPDVVECWEGISVDSGVVDHGSRVADVNANPEEGCCILKLVCRHYASITPAVLGHWLADIKVSLTSDMRCHRVQMSFGSQSYNCSPLRRANRSTLRGVLEVVEFSPVENVNVFHWWHPQYPIA